MNLTNLFEQLISGQHLTALQMADMMNACITGKLSDAQIASFLALMRMKGETPVELTTAATVMLKSTHCIDLGHDLIDIVGTGGDGRNTFNVSTISSIVAASAGARVAKHGGRSVSSRSGSADFLIEAGFALELSDTALKHCIEQCNLAFLFAPHFNQAFQHVHKARRELGIRTFLNLLGPLINPARTKRQVVGVFASCWQEPVAQVLANLGSERVLVIHSLDGLDEISIAAKTEVLEYDKGQFKRWMIDPVEYDCGHLDLEGIIIQTPAQSLALASKVLQGQPGAARDIILLNSAAALYCAGVVVDFKQGIEKAVAAIDSGAAMQCFTKLKALTQCYSKKAEKG